MSQVYHYAVCGACRSGATRFGYTSPRAFISINGTPYGASTRANALAPGVLMSDLSVQEILHETANTASLATVGVEPAEGADLVLTLGSINNTDRLFAGPLLNRRHGYFEKPVNWTASYNAIDYTWLLTRRNVSGQFTNAAPATIAAAIVAQVPGLTLSVQSGLSNLDSFSYTDVTALAALTQLAQRIGGYVDVDYRKVVKLFIADSSVTNPTDLTATHPTLSDFSYTKDLSQIRTRVFVEGGGVNALAPCVAGETIIPVSTNAWYSVGGGLLKSGPQHLSYSTVTPPGIGTLVGPGATPASAPVVAHASGAGLATGTYQYAYTDVTAAGESLPSPLATILASGSATVLAAPSVSYTGGSALIGGVLQFGYYGFALTFYDAFGETTPAPQTAVYLSGTPYNTLQFTGVSTGPAGTIGRRLYRTTVQASSGAALAAQLYLDQDIADNVTTTVNDTVLDAALGPVVPVANTQFGQVALSAIALGPTGTTSRKIYRTVANGSQLKLQQTIANNTALVGVQDATADGSLGANVPTSDTSGLTQPSGQVTAGSTTLLSAGSGPFRSGGGWAVIGNGQQVIRYTGLNGNTLTGIPASGVGAITATIAYNSTITAPALLVGIPTSGTGAIQYPILQGDAVNLLVQSDDLAAQTALAALIGGTDDGIVEEYVQDGTIGITEATARGVAELALHSTVLISITYRCRDKNTHAGRVVHVNLPSPTSLTGDFEIQRVTVNHFVKSGVFPTYTVEASSSRFSLEDLLRLARAA